MEGLIIKLAFFCSTYSKEQVLESNMSMHKDALPWKNALDSDFLATKCAKH